MSNEKAIAAVSKGLVHLLFGPVDAAVSGALVKVSLPENPQTVAGNVVNIYLYQVTPNAALRNVDLPTRGSNGHIMHRPQAALDLHYILSFYSKEALNSQKMLGAVVRTLHAQPFLQQHDLSTPLPSPGGGGGGGSGNSESAQDLLEASKLNQQVESVKFTMENLSLEEFSKLWSVFFQTPYILSVAYKATVVLIEADEAPSPALPVQEAGVYAEPLRNIVIERIWPQGNPRGRIVPGDQLVITGTELRGIDGTTLLIDDVDTPLAFPAESGRLEAAMPAGLRAGTHRVQVIHDAPAGSEHPVWRSNPAAFVLHPVINQGTLAATTLNQPNAGAPWETTISVTLDPPVEKGQQVALLLNKLGEPEVAFSVETIAAPVAPATNVSDFDFIVQGVEEGTYLVRAQVDGAESLLEANDASDQLKYTDPSILIEK